MCGCDTMLLYTTHQEDEETKVSIICGNCASLTGLDEVIPNDTAKPLQS